jgi:hypothetical protein
MDEVIAKNRAQLDAYDVELQTEIREEKEKIARLRRQVKLNQLARAKLLRALAGIPERPHRKDRSAEAAVATETTAEADAAVAAASSSDDSAGGGGADYVFGAMNIGKEVGLTPDQVYNWHRNGYFGDAVWNVGPKTLAGKISKLRNLGPR